MPRFVLAPDSFKESMTAKQACEAMKSGILAVYPQATCISAPMADGGEGTVDALVTALEGEYRTCVVQGPLADQRVTAQWGYVAHERLAIIEMAAANGIDLLSPTQRNPLLTSTYGTGELIRAALDLNVKKIMIGLGGSVTNDAGSGMAYALGAKFLDAVEDEVIPCGGVLDRIQQIDLTGLDPRLESVEICIASDVTNPLTGVQGASYIFAPQKGATCDMVKQLDANLSHFAHLVEDITKRQVKDQAGAGAAGGLGFGLLSFTQARIQSGIELVMSYSQLEEKIAQADYVFTGEGKIDQQTQYGKTPFGVALLAKRHGKLVFAFAGKVAEGVQDLYRQEFEKIVSINPPDCDLATALQYAPEYLESTVQQVVSQL